MGINKLQPRFSITPLVLKLIAEIDEFKGQWKVFSGLTPERLTTLKKIATIESVGSSTRIEGSKLTDQEVEALLTGLKRKSFRSRDEEEVAGYAEAMDTLFESYKNIFLTENYVRQFHGILLRHSTKDVYHRGEYKKFPNHVEAFDPNGKSLGIIFQPTSPFQTPFQMKELILWANRELEEKTLHPLLITSIFIVNFLAIHPFQDGNGRISRILTTYLLLKTGYSYVPYSSLERLIEENKDRYYLALRASQKSLRTKKENLNPWILFFLKALKKQKDGLLQKMEKEKWLQTQPLLSQKILELAKDHGKLTNGLVQKITKANRNTIKVHLAKLVNDGLLKKLGEGKGSEYTLK